LNNVEKLVPFSSKIMLIMQFLSSISDLILYATCSKTKKLVYVEI
jgi:hypothetical protein